MSDLATEDVGRIRILTLTRESSLNAFDNALYRDVAGALDSARRDAHIAVTVLTGSGRAFSAGQDMAQMADIGHEIGGSGAAESASNADEAGFPDLMAALERFDKPLIAAVNGLGVGLGFTILAHCDLVVMADDARLRAPFCPLGVAPEAASSVLFPQRMGWQKAAWVLFSGEWITAAEALEAGIAWKVVPTTEVVSAALEAAQSIARWPIPSLVATKRALLDGRSAAVRRARDVEDAAFGNLIGSPGNIEAVMAFLEKRNPDFTGIDGA
jgi:enoyl-CoA hydratase/carnithine racemase